MKKLRELLSDESKWTQHAWARNECNQVLDSYSSPYACKFCLTGGLNKLDLSPEERNAKIAKIVNYISALPDSQRFVDPLLFNGRIIPEYSISVFNDNSTWQDVDTMLNKLDI